MDRGDRHDHRRSDDCCRSWQTVTGWGFVLFSVVACLWVYSGLTASDGLPIAIQNGLLLLVNLYGVWQFLISRKKKRRSSLSSSAPSKPKNRLPKRKK